MTRKAVSMRRWKARFQLGKFIPYVVCVEYPKLHNWLKRQDANFAANRDGYLKSRARPLSYHPSALWPETAGQYY